MAQGPGRDVTEQRIKVQEEGSQGFLSKWLCRVGVSCVLCTASDLETVGTGQSERGVRMQAGTWNPRLQTSVRKTRM